MIETREIREKFSAAYFLLSDFADEGVHALEG